MKRDLDSRGRWQNVDAFERVFGMDEYGCVFLIPCVYIHVSVREISGV